GEDVGRAELAGHLLPGRVAAHRDDPHRAELSGRHDAHKPTAPSPTTTTVLPGPACAATAPNHPVPSTSEAVSRLGTSSGSGGPGVATSAPSASGIRARSACVPIEPMSTRLTHPLRTSCGAYRIAPRMVISLANVPFVPLSRPPPRPFHRTSRHRPWSAPCAGKPAAPALAPRRDGGYRPVGRVRRRSRHACKALGSPCPARLVPAPARPPDRTHPTSGRGLVRTARRDHHGHRPAPAPPRRFAGAAAALCPCPPASPPAPPAPHTPPPPTSLTRATASAALPPHGLPRGRTDTGRVSCWGEHLVPPRVWRGTTEY